MKITERLLLRLCHDVEITAAIPCRVTVNLRLASTVILRTTVRRYGNDSGLKRGFRLPQRLLTCGVELGAEITLSRVGQENYYAFSLVLGTLGKLYGGRGGGSTGNAYQETLVLRKLATCA